MSAVVHRNMHVYQRRVARHQRSLRRESAGRLHRRRHAGRRRPLKRSTANDVMHRWCRRCWLRVKTRRRCARTRIEAGRRRLHPTVWGRWLARAADVCTVGAASVVDNAKRLRRRERGGCEDRRRCTGRVTFRQRHTERRRRDGQRGACARVCRRGAAAAWLNRSRRAGRDRSGWRRGA